MSTESPERSGGHEARTRILVVDDDGEMRALLADVLGDEGYDVVEAANGAEALIRLRADSFAAIVLDKNMPGLSGLDLLPGLRVICPETPVILITAFGDVATYMEAMEKGAYEYVFKPFRMEELLRVLRRALPSGARSGPSPSAAGATP
ncbi:MAG: response regulator [candidate division NC10 bacterium]|nr:response regulator [candidate division NC10 bacterium]MBI2163178.1 response regulator [candidate division NC10 bacterium]MBI2456789.1 response regulator [candidate division NC10 bacterium]MBI2564177.1 response regulator [candidate division NC10 bacterium]MBI3086074.1 response regulator [candidate division NC10 bacterium]